MRPLTLISAALVLAGAGAVAFAAGTPMAIVASTAPDLRPGDLVAEGQAIAVPAGAIVQLFTVTGREINVSGPFSGVPGGEGAPPPEDKLQVLAAALFGRTDIAVSSDSSGSKVYPQTNGAGDEASMSPSVAVSPSGTWCLAGDVHTVLVRNEGLRGEASLVSLDDGQSAPLGWSNEADVTDWPSALPPKDGGRYAVQMDGRDATSFTVRLMPEAVNGAGRLAQMAAAGCQQQVSDAIGAMVSAVQHPQE